MMRKLFLAFFLFLCCSAVQSQQFIRSGKITYERKVNLWANMGQEFSEEAKKSVPQFDTDLFTLNFDEGHSLYKAESEIKTRLYNVTARNNVVYADYTSDKYVASKNIFENTYLVKDSLSKIKWKIKDDFREIAGFTCRRATTILFDSVFVVAFYTDEITLPGGPESFHGLPGTILGLVVNRLHTTWYATKVELDNIDEKQIAPPNKGVQVDYQEIIRKLSTAPISQSGEMQKLHWMILI